MIRAGNYSITVYPDRPPEEQDSFTCGHCSKVTFIKPGQRADDIGGLCKVCMNLICPQCTDLLTCDPFERKLERDEAKDRFNRQIAGLR